MAFGIITILLALVPFVLYTQPIIWAYTGESREILNETYKEISCYEGISFEGQTLYIIGNVFMIASLVFAVLTVVLTIINMVGKPSSNKKVVGVKVCAFFFFLFSLTAVVLIGIHLGQTFGVQEFDDVFKSTVGYGLLGSMFASLFALIFAPKRKVE